MWSCFRSYGTNYTEAGCGCEDIVGYYKYYYDVCVVISNGSYVYSKGDCSSEGKLYSMSYLLVEFCPDCEHFAHRCNC